MSTTFSFDPAQLASEHAGRELRQGCGPWLLEEEGALSGYTYDWETIDVLAESISEEGEEAELLQELQLRSPSGEVLHTEARRILRYRRDSYPGGDYTVVVDL